MTTAYPLSWPHGWPRTLVHRRKTPQFRRQDHGVRSHTVYRDLTLDEARKRLVDELDKIGADNCVLSTNVVLRIDGTPRMDRTAPADPGAACYFALKGRPTVLACDRWLTVAGNIAAIAAHMDALRSIDRYGVGSVEQAFAGYAAIEAPRSCWQILGIAPGSTDEQVDDAYFRLAKVRHPDAGGSNAAMADLNRARQEAKNG